MKLLIVTLFAYAVMLPVGVVGKPAGPACINSVEENGKCVLRRRK